MYKHGYGKTEFSPCAGVDFVGMLSGGLRSQPVTRNIAVRSVEFDADEAAALELCSEQRRAGAAERIEDEVAGAREALD